MKKKIISVVLTSLILFSGTTFAYKDIDNHWAKPHINKMKNAGVLEQFGENNIDPDKPMTRAECAELISDFLEKYYGYVPQVNENVFKFDDLTRRTSTTNKIRALSRLTYKSYMTSPIQDYSNNKLVLKDARIIEGYPSVHNTTEFKPNNPVTRAEFTKMFINAMDCFGYISASNFLRYASDTDLHWSQMYMHIGHAYGVIDGYATYYGDYIMRMYDPNGSINEYEVSSYKVLKPDGNVTRAEAIKILSSARESTSFRYVGINEPNQSPTRPKDEKQLYYLKD